MTTHRERPWAARSRDSLRLDEIGDVAEPWEIRTIRARLAPLAVAVATGKLPRIVFLAPLAMALQGARRPARAELVMRELAPVIDLVVALLTLDARDEERLRELHRLVRATPSPGLDAVEDVFARIPSVRPMLEVERMHRVGLLVGDWSLTVDENVVIPGFVATRVNHALRMSTITA